jgi:phosphohistidine phosphatase
MTSPDTSSRRLLLLRHAKSAYPGVADHERPLADRGRRDARAAGRWLRETGCVPDYVVCSTAQRARQTWQLAAAQLAADPPITYDERVYQASVSDLLELARDAPPSAHTMLVVGHDPAIQELALTLAGAQAAADGLLDRMASKFPTSSIAVLEVTGSWPELMADNARLTRFVVPREFTAGPGG